VPVKEIVEGQPRPFPIEDALEETTTAVTGISAEYGRFTGGVVNAVTRSGGNQLSGSLRVSLDSEAWRSLTPYERENLVDDPRDDAVVPTYEGTFGGPILQDKLWYLLNFRSTGTRRTVVNLWYNKNANDPTKWLYEPDFEYVVVPFDEIQQAVLEGKADMGLLIHEGQLTYAEEGLQKVVDLGEWWADHTGGLPLPLGGNIIRRDLGPEMIAKVSKMLHDSIAYALTHREEAVEYAIQFGRGLDRERTDTFVGMYVNNLTLAYGDRGRMAVERLLAEAFEKGLIPQRVPIEFAA